jgi:hypothetical protein
MQLQKLKTEKNCVIAQLLGKPTQGGDDSANTIAAIPPVEATFSMPLVWQDVDTNKIALEDGQLAAIGALREEFMARIGGTNQDPSSPAYLQQWQKAQPEMDDALAGMIGRKAFLDYQLLSVQSTKQTGSH